MFKRRCQSRTEPPSALGQRPISELAFKRVHGAGSHAGLCQPVHGICEHKPAQAWGWHYVRFDALETLASSEAVSISEATDLSSGDLDSPDSW